MMKQTIWLVALLTVFSLPMNAQNNYSRLWAKVQKAQKEGRPQTAAACLRELEEKTIKAGDELEHLVVSETLYGELQKYNWKEANQYYPSYSALNRRVMVDSLESYIVKYKEHPRVMMLLYRQLCNHKEQIDRKSYPRGEDYLGIREECRALLKHRYAGNYKKSIQGMIDDMESLSLSCDSHSTMAPSKGVEYNIATRNVDKVDVKVYRMLDNKVFLYGYEDESETLLRKNATLVSSHTVDGFRNEFNIREHRQTKVDFAEPGIYVVRFSAAGEVCCDQVNVSRVAGALRVREGRAEVYAADLVTGKPFGEGKLSLYRDLGENNKSSILNLRSSGSSYFSGDGFVAAEVGKALKDRKHSWQMRIENRDDIYAPMIYVPFADDYKSADGAKDGLLYEQKQLFTDRKLYKPGDEIHFKVIFFKASQTVGEVLEGKEVKIRIRHSSESEPKAEVKLVTNEFGSVAGSFTLPEGSKNGIYVIETAYSRLGTVRVEEYKRPNFKVSLEPVTEPLTYGDIVRQGGQMKSYAGFSVAGGELWYKITRTTRCRRNGRYFGMEVVMEGSVVSDGDGRFEIVFPAKRPEYKDYEDELLISNYSISVTATDPQGETHSISTGVPVADIPVEINVHLPENEHFGSRLIVDKDRTKSVTVEGSSLNGFPYESEGEWRLFNADSSLVRSGTFTTNKPLDFDFATLPSGDYRLAAELQFRGRSVKSSSDVVVLSTDDRKLPFKSRYFYYPVETDGAIEFLIGTTEDDLYLELELFDDDRQLYREGLHLQNELRKFRLPYKEEYRSAVKMSVFGFRGGEKIDRTYEFKRPGDVRFGVSLETFRDKTTPNTEETMTLRVPSGTELVVSIYDVTTDRYGTNSFTFIPLREYAYVSRPGISTSIDSYRAYGLRYSKNAAFGAAMAEEMEMMDAAVMQRSADSDEAAEAEEAEAPEFEARKNFSELIAFYPQVRSDESGLTSISYKTSDLLSTYRVLVSAHDKRMHTGGTEAEFVVQQELIVQPNIPLFVTEGDRIVLKAKLVNLGKRELKGTAYVEIKDANGKKLKLKGMESKKRSLLAGGQDEVSWTVEIPGGTGHLDVKIWFATPEASDGEEHRVQVVPATITLTEAASFIIGGPHSHKYYERQLRKQFGAADPKIEYAEYSTLDAVKESLPKAEEPSGQNSIDWINQLYINQMRNFVLKDDPADYEDFRRNAISRISNFQGGDGGIQWFPGMKSNTVLTLYFLEKLGQMRRLGAFAPGAGEMKMIRKALKYIDDRIEVQGSYKTFAPFGFIRDFAVRSLWYDVEMSKGAKAVYDRFAEETADGWQNISILEKSQLINLMLRASGTAYDDKSFARRVRQLRESLKDYAVENPTVGCYFPNAVMPFRGLMNNEIYAHAQLIETFGSLGEKKMVDGVAQWLLLQKHNQAWENTVATTDAVYALVSSGARNLKLGAVYYTYTTRLDRVKASANEIRIERFFSRPDGRPVEDGEQLHAGDEIIVRYQIHNTENRSFVQMRAMRPASFYPRDERSYFTWYGFYREVKTSETNYYWELLPEEYITVEERFFVQQEGLFNSGLVEIECLYAKEYRGHTDAVSIASGAPARLAAAPSR